tara:strand:+ start:243 stop:659 length:417 start_codon:yes stop_codon:yes gene_type:complete
MQQDSNQLPFYQPKGFTNWFNNPQTSNSKELISHGKKPDDNLVKTRYSELGVQAVTLTMQKAFNMMSKRTNSSTKRHLNKSFNQNYFDYNSRMRMIMINTGVRMSIDGLSRTEFINAENPYSNMNKSNSKDNKNRTDY